MTQTRLDPMPGTEGGEDAFVGVLLHLCQVVLQVGPHSSLAQATIPRLLAALEREAPGTKLTVAFHEGSVFLEGELVHRPADDAALVSALSEALLVQESNAIVISADADTRALTSLCNALFEPASEVKTTARATITQQPTRSLRGLGATASPRDRIARVYADGVLTVRRHHDGVLRRDLSEVDNLRTMASRILTEVSEHPAEAEGAVLMRDPPGDNARVAMNAALLMALLAGVTDMPLREAHLGVLATLLAKSGRAKVAGLYRPASCGAAAIPRLDDAMKTALPGATALLLMQRTTGLAPELLECAATYETVWLEHSDLLDWPYKRVIPPTACALLAATSLRVCAEMTTSQTTKDLADKLAAGTSGRVEIAALRLAFAVLGLTQRGGPARLSSWDLLAESDPLPTMITSDDALTVESKDSLELDDSEKTRVDETRHFFQKN